MVQFYDFTNNNNKNDAILEKNFFFFLNFSILLYFNAFNQFFFWSYDGNISLSIFKIPIHFHNFYLTF